MADTHERVEHIEKISESSKSGAGKEIETADKIAPSKEAFDTAMAKLPERPPATATVTYVDPLTTKRSLLDEVRELNQKVETVGKTTTGDLAAQAKDLIAQIEDVKGRLAEPNVELKESVQTLLRNKLSHIDENLKIALNKAGVEYVAPTSQQLANPIDRFMGLLTHGQHQLQSMAAELENAANNKFDFSPAKMLVVQIKVGYIQQELEFFTNLLNKSLESTKTIMNVQV